MLDGKRSKPVKTMSNTKLTQFTVDGNTVPIRYIETQTVKEGVECDLYVFTDDSSKDLAIVRVARGHKTPLQRVLLGNKTIEGLQGGTGALTVRSANGQTQEQHTFNSPNDQAIIVNVGQIIQWHANGYEDLIFYEICEPPYTDGRFENIE